MFNKLENKDPLLRLSYYPAKKYFFSVLHEILNNLRDLITKNDRKYQVSR